MTMLFIFLGLLPSMVWLTFFLQEDAHPEPRKAIFFVFLGGVIAAFLAVFSQYGLQEVFNQKMINTNSVYSIMSFAAIEEIFKFLLVFIIISRTRYFDEPIDAMIYMITVALGMAAVENVSLMTGQEAATDKIGLLVLRFLGATLLHALSSSIVGYYWAKGIIKDAVFSFITIGLLFGIILHGVFNYLIVVLSRGIIYSIVFLMMASFFIFYDFEKLKSNR
ncbi:MAG: PrsW family glutamic-type intramembrane protease [Patescibacteria group bacterium]|nr:PrsW family glutamic-type intramembrane protease [Patescibacteria group bacterium]